MKSTSLSIMHAGLAVLLAGAALSVVPSGLKVGSGVKRSPSSIADVLAKLPKGQARAVKSAMSHSNPNNHKIIAGLANQAILARRPQLQNRKAA